MNENEIRAAIVKSTFDLLPVEDQINLFCALNRKISAKIAWVEKVQ